MPNSQPTRLATYFHVHLVSDSTGETLNAMARAVCARFENVMPIEHIYALVRSQRQLDRALGDIEEALRREFAELVACLGVKEYPEVSAD